METQQETEKKIGQLQLLEQNMQSFLMQKQTVQSQQVEIENAINELSKAQGAVYKIVGSVMISADKDEVKKDLESKKEILLLRLKNIEKQEAQIREKAESIQGEVLSKLKKEDEEKK